MTMRNLPSLVSLALLLFLTKTSSRFERTAFRQEMSRVVFLAVSSVVQSTAVVSGGAMEYVGNHRRG